MMHKLHNNSYGKPEKPIKPVVKSTGFSRATEILKGKYRVRTVLIFIEEILITSVI